MAPFLSDVIILGIDPGLLRTGWGVIRAKGNKLEYVAHGVILPPAKVELATRLGAIFNGLCEIIEIHRPDEAAIEETFVANSPKTSILLGQARGAAMVALSHKNLDVFEYSTRLIKKAVVGTGAAEKDQIGFMVKRLLPTSNVNNADAADALAAAIAHSSLRNAPMAVKKGSK